jgi:hypothetical protein
VLDLPEGDAQLSDSELDAALCEVLCSRIERLAASQDASKPFAPLPVLGVPGWHAGNVDAEFYANSAVFRAASAAP